MTVRSWRRIVVLAVMVAVFGASMTPSGADNQQVGEQAAAQLTIAVIGDMPYSDQQIAAFQGFVNALSGDSTFDLVIHLGDIKSGSSACTDAYTKGIRDALNSYAGALVYTPGDNEWTDCHRNASTPSNPVDRLKFIRSKFFYQPGMTLGVAPRPVLTQGGSGPFAAFVENQAWVQAKVVFAVVNLPGSNNDLDPWTHNVGTPAQQKDEFDTRLAADLAWLEQVFALAQAQHARAVVLGIQADMWDPAAGAAELTGYTEIVQKLAALALSFGKPVLLLNGDSHNFEVDNPLANGDVFNRVSVRVPNLTRITVQGGPDHFPFEYLRVTIDTRGADARFSWERVTPTLAP